MGINNIEKRQNIEVSNPLAFFQIQLAFAQKVSSIKGIPLNEALLKFTTFYIRIGIKDWKHNQDNQKWQEFVLGIQKGEDPAELAYSTYMKRYSPNESQSPPKSCFSCSYDEKEKNVSIHFQNNFSSDGSPLSKDNVPQRISELKNIFEDIKAKHPDARMVKGGSWLYSYDSYKRLFPPEYVAGLKESRGGFRGNGRWGQFLTSSGSLNEERTQQFLNSVNKATTETELINSFPFKFYETEAPIQTFYKHLGLQNIRA